MAGGPASPPYSTVGYKAGYWIGPITLRRTAKPNLENERHRENSLKLCVQEAKNLPTKRRYFCDVCLDRTLYARTTSKPVSDAVFWGEEFDLNNLPDVSVVTLNLYREADPSKDGKKKKKKNQNQLISYVTILVSEISKRSETQCWLTMQPAGDTTPPGSGGGALGHDKTSPVSTSASGGSTNGGGSSSGALAASRGGRPASDLPQIRVRMRFQSVDILPIRCYQSLSNLVSNNYAELVTLLEGMVTVRVKEDMAGSLVNMHEKGGSAHTFLTDLVLQEIITLDNDSLVLRSNTFASKAMECYLKLVAGKYMQEMLQDFVHTVLSSPEDCEVDPSKLTQPGQLLRNQTTLVSFASAMLNKIFYSETYFPSELRLVFSTLRAAVQPTKGSDLCDRLISGCLFLRLICPAVLSPCLFGLAQEFPEAERISRNLTLLAKTLQTLANGSLFEDKEVYMCFLNSSLLERELPRMRGFLTAISSPTTLPPATSATSSLEKRQQSNPVSSSTSSSTACCHDYIDLGYECALLYIQVSDAIAQIPKENSTQLVTQLRTILQEITTTLDNFMPPVRRSNTSSLRHATSVPTPHSSSSSIPSSTSQHQPDTGSTVNTPCSPQLPHSSEDLTSYLSQHTRPADHHLVAASEDYAIHPFPASSYSSLSSCTGNRGSPGVPATANGSGGSASDYVYQQAQQQLLSLQNKQQQLRVSRKTVSLETANQRQLANSSPICLESEQMVNDSWNQILALAERSTDTGIKTTTNTAAALPLSPLHPHQLDDDLAYDNEEDRETLYDAVAPSGQEEEDGQPAVARPASPNQSLRFFNPLYGLYPHPAPPVVAPPVNKVRLPSNNTTTSGSGSSSLSSPPAVPDIAFITAGIEPPPLEEPLLPPLLPGNTTKSSSSSKSRPVRRRSSSQGRMGAAATVAVTTGVGGGVGESGSGGSVVSESPGRSRRNSGGSSRHSSKGSRHSKKSSKEYESEIGELSRQLGETLARLNSMEQLLDQREREKQNLEKLVRLVTSPSNTLQSALDGTSGGEGVAVLLNRLRGVDQSVCLQQRQMDALLADGNRFMKQRQLRIMELEAAGAGLQACLDDVGGAGPPPPSAIPPSGDTYC